MAIVVAADCRSVVMFGSCWTLQYDYPYLHGVCYRRMMITCDAMQIKCLYSCLLFNLQLLVHWLHDHVIMHGDTTQYNIIKGKQSKKWFHPLCGDAMYVTICHCVIELHYTCTSFHNMTATHQCQLPLYYCRSKIPPKVKMLGKTVQ